VRAKWLDYKGERDRRLDRSLKTAQRLGILGSELQRPAGRFNRHYAQGITYETKTVNSCQDSAVDTSLLWVLPRKTSIHRLGIALQQKLRE
jgi:hypothetical protein